MSTIAPVIRKPVIALALLLTAACQKEMPAATGSATADTAGTYGDSDTAAKRGETAPPVTDTVPPPDAGTPMPAYSAAKLGGGTYDVAEQRGKVVLFNVWATWCGPCRAETPDLQELHKRYTARGLEVVGVSVDEGGETDVKPFVAEFKVEYPIVLDPEGKAASVLRTDVLPTTVLIDRNGTIVWRRVGPVPHNDEGLKQAIEKALG